MNISKSMILTTLVAAVVAGSACTPRAGEKATAVTKDLAQETADATKEIAARIADGAKEIAGEVADTSQAVTSAMGEAITDGWITATTSAKFVDDTLLDGSEIDVDTNDGVVTLNGTVRSVGGRARAEALARSTEGVTEVVNQLVVKS
jgi:osmotically-inducible protein OsmY